MQPLLYVSFGMGKAGSTLAFNLVREILIAAGRAQPQLAAAGASRDNFIARLSPEVLAAARTDAAAAGGPVAVKTHRGPMGCVKAAVREGWVTGHAVCRDPRDIALSMVDATRKGLGWGEFGGRGFAAPEETLPVIRNHVKRFEAWAALPGILAVPYEMLAFETETMARRMAAQIRVEVDIPRAVRAAKMQRNQFNVGRSERWRREMDPALAAEIEGEFAGFIARWCTERPAEAPRKGLLGRLVR